MKPRGNAKVVTLHACSATLQTVRSEQPCAKASNQPHLMDGMVSSVHLPSFHAGLSSPSPQSYPLPPHLVRAPAIYSGRSPPFQPQMPGRGGTGGRGCGPYGGDRNSAASSSTQSGFFQFGGPSVNCHIPNFID